MTQHACLSLRPGDPAMPHVPLVLTEVQRLFRAFETERIPATQLAYLSDALAWLADVAAEEPSPAFQRQCAQMATAYARYIQRKVQPLLRHTRPVDAEVEAHWIQVLQRLRKQWISPPCRRQAKFRGTADPAPGTRDRPDVSSLAERYREGCQSLSTGACASFSPGADTGPRMVKLRLRHV